MLDKPFIYKPLRYSHKKEMTIQTCVGIKIAHKTDDMNLSY